VLRRRGGVRCARLREQLTAARARRDHVVELRLEARAAHVHRGARLLRLCALAPRRREGLSHFRLRRLVRVHEAVRLRHLLRQVAGLGLEGDVLRLKVAREGLALRGRFAQRPQLALRLRKDVRGSESNCEQDSRKM